MADRDSTSPPVATDSSDGADSSGGPDTTADPATSANHTTSGGHDTTADPTSPERWLYAGESVVARESLGTGWLAVTTHRLLVYTPDTDGPTFSGYDRLNVETVRVDAGGDSRYLGVLPRVVVYALVCFGGWFAFGKAGLTDLLAVDASDSLSVVGMAGLFGTIRTGLRLLELAMLGGGFLLLLTAMGIFGLYVHSRRSRVVVDVAGTGTVTVPLPPGATTGNIRLDRIQDALTSA